VSAVSRYRVRPEPSTRIWPYFELWACSALEAAGALLDAGDGFDVLPLELPHPAANTATAPTPAETVMSRFTVDSFSLEPPLRRMHAGGHPPAEGVLGR
jgi:hypothetical protein